MIRFGENKIRLFGRRRLDVHIMSATAEEAADIAAVHASSFKRAWSEEEFLALLSSRGCSVWTARIRGRTGLAGFILVRQAADEAEIITIAALPRFRGRGVGAKLLDHAIREMHRDRIKRLVLEVDEGNMAAIQLYASRGFKRISMRQGYYANDRQTPGQAPSNALVMAVDLR